MFRVTIAASATPMPKPHARPNAIIVFMAILLTGGAMILRGARSKVHGSLPADTSTPPPAKLAASALSDPLEHAMIKARTIFVLLASGLAATALAEPKPETVIEYRQSVMTMIGWNFVPLSARWSRARFRSMRRNSPSAPSVSNSSRQQALEGFAKGSDKGAKTDAKAEIWSELRRFSDQAERFDHADQDACRRRQDRRRGEDEGTVQENSAARARPVTTSTRRIEAGRTEAQRRLKRENI